MTKIDPNVFVEAAEIAANGEYACVAIMTACLNFSCNDNIFLNFFRDIYVDGHGYVLTGAWLTDKDLPKTDIYAEEGRTRRVLALLFAAEIARDEDL